jgi:hypothetical protein
MMVAHTLPRNSVIPLTPHPAEENPTYVHQGMAGINLFDKIEEEHMETPSLSRYNTSARARQHSANQAHFLAPRVCRPIALTNNQGIAVAPIQDTTHIPMDNAVINQDTGAAWSNATSYKMTPPSACNKAAANEFGRVSQCVGG